MRYVIAYDIADNARRARTAKLLESLGERVQGSVFEADLNDKVLTRLQERLKKIIDPTTDGVRFYRLCGECARAVAVVGLGKVTRTPEVMIV